MPGSRRTPIPLDIAAQVQFDANRTCCVCRDAAKPIQIHHIDGDPGNHAIANLATLCLECHNLTLLQGGFTRKLDAEQIILFRNDWTAVVADSRLPSRPSDSPTPGRETDAALATSIVEILRERDDVVNLALHYSMIGNDELRDRYIEQALGSDPDPDELFRWRAVQGRLSELPQELIDEQLERVENIDLTAYARDLMALRRFEQAAGAYARVVIESIDDERPFTAAFYIREMARVGLIEGLLIRALAKAREEDDLWWQMRALQELGWDDELARFFRENAERIEASDDETLRALLAEFDGRLTDALEHRKQAARAGEQPYVWYPPEDETPAPAGDADGDPPSETGDPSA